MGKLRRSCKRGQWRRNPLWSRQRFRRLPTEHLMVEKLVWREEMKEVSEEKMKEVSEEKMKEVSEEEMKEENKVEMVNSRVRHTVWRHWEEERVAEVRGLVDVGEKEKVADHLRVKLVTHDGTP